MARKTWSLPEMDPTFLETQEIEHELSIRHVVGLTSIRDKTYRLRSFLLKEKKGELEWPKDPPFNEQEEIQIVLENLATLIQGLEDARGENREFDILKCSTRLRHYLERGLRIVDKTETLEEIMTQAKMVLEKEYIDELKKDENKMLSKIKQREDQNELRRVTENVERLSINVRSSLGRGRGLPVREHLGFQNNHPKIGSQNIGNQEQAPKQSLVSSGGHIEPKPTRFANSLNEGPMVNHSAPSINNPPHASDSMFQSLHGFQQKMVPVHKWNLYFSGESGSMSLMDFFINLDLLAQTEGAMKQELFHSIHYLLKGQAKSWYVGNRKRLQSWDDLVAEMKKEFHPLNYDFLIREDIMARVQQPNESFSHFMIDMNLLFDKVYPPLDEQFKLYVIKRNMLSQYSFQLSTVVIHSLDHLIQLCRQMDESKLIDLRRNNPRGAYVMEPANFPRSTVQPARRVSVISQEPVEQIMEVNYINNNSRYLGQNPNPNPTNQYRFSNQNSLNRPINRTNYNLNRPRGACWNCEQVGHRHYDCPAEERKIFCWYCGRKDVTSANCPRNHPIARRHSNQVDSSGNSNLEV